MVANAKSESRAGLAEKPFSTAQKTHWWTASNPPYDLLPATATFAAETTTSDYSQCPVEHILLHRGCCNVCLRQWHPFGNAGQFGYVRKTRTGRESSLIWSLPDEGEAAENIHEAILAGTHDAAARHVPAMTVEMATELLLARSSFAITPTTVAHSVTSPSNSPCEDTSGSGIFNLFNDPAKDWCEWTVFDGHAGPRTSQYLKDSLPVAVGDALWQAKCMQQPRDAHIVSTIKKAFQQLDNDIVMEAGKRLQAGGPLAEMVALAAAATSGSCALMALYDPARSILRVANVGDSRAVLGRWNPVSHKYVAMPLSVDHTGFNQEEVTRIEREHPDEEGIVDPKSGRVFGLAISRAFGDARWKWPNDLTQLVHEKFFGPAPRPNGVVKTPPYITAEPDITTTKVNTSEDHPDFLIMASDGLWDHFSSEDAVTCVQQWLDKNKPAAFLQAHDRGGTCMVREKRPEYKC